MVPNCRPISSFVAEWGVTGCLHCSPWPGPVVSSHSKPPGSTLLAPFSWPDSSQGRVRLSLLLQDTQHSSPG